MITGMSGSSMNSPLSILRPVSMYNIVLPVVNFWMRIHPSRSAKKIQHFYWHHFSAKKGKSSPRGQNHRTEFQFPRPAQVGRGLGRGAGRKKPSASSPRPSPPRGRRGRKSLEAPAGKSGPGKRRASVLECGSPLPLWVGGGMKKSGRGLPQFKTARTIPAGLGVSGLWSCKSVLVAK